MSETQRGDGSEVGDEAFDPRPAGGASHDSGLEDVQLPAGGSRQADEPAAEFAPVACTIELVLDHYQSGFVSRMLDDPRVQCSRITIDQAIALKLLSSSLNRQGARMLNARYVQSNPDALRYVLDQLVAQIPSELMERLKAEAG